MAFIICAVAMYGFWWHKPFNVEHRYIVLKLKRNDDEEPHASNSQDQKCDFDSRIDDLDGDKFAEYIMPFISDAPRSWLGNLILYIPGGLFCAVHVAAWNWVFPSSVIQALWRWSSLIALVLSTCLPFFILTFRSIWYFTWFMIGDDAPSGTTGVTLLLCLSAYTFSRLTILVLTFYCFTSMPQKVYERVEWTGFIPHFA